MLRVVCMLLFSFFNFLHGNDFLYLRDNLKKARAGDFVVALQNKNYIILHIYNRNNDHLIIEEINVPTSKIDTTATPWKEWIMKGASGHTSWIMYMLDLNNAKSDNYYSVTKHAWFEMPSRENILTTLLNLRMEELSIRERKKVGVAIVPNTESRTVWNPKLIINGQTIPNVDFDAWRTKWPQDGSELAGKIVEAYTPHDPQYPSYFPYWLQISGAVGNAKIRIVDSGHDMLSPAPTVFELPENKP